MKKKKGDKKMNSKERENLHIKIPKLVENYSLLKEYVRKYKKEFLDTTPNHYLLGSVSRYIDDFIDFVLHKEIGIVLEDETKKKEK